MVSRHIQVSPPFRSAEVINEIFLSDQIYSQADSLTENQVSEFKEAFSLFVGSSSLLFTRFVYILNTCA